MTIKPILQESGKEKKYILTIIGILSAINQNERFCQNHKCCKKSRSYIRGLELDFISGRCCTYTMGFLRRKFKDLESKKDSSRRISLILPSVTIITNNLIFLPFISNESELRFLTCLKLFIIFRYICSCQ